MNTLFDRRDAKEMKVECNTSVQACKKIKPCKQRTSKKHDMHNSLICIVIEQEDLESNNNMIFFPSLYNEMRSGQLMATTKKCGQRSEQMLRNVVVL